MWFCFFFLSCFFLWLDRDFLSFCYLISADEVRVAVVVVECRSRSFGWIRVNAARRARESCVGEVRVSGRRMLRWLCGRCRSRLVEF